MPMRAVPFDPAVTMTATSDLDGQRSRMALALSDFGQTVERWRLCRMLAFSDVRRRYRRSVIGPLWMTLSMALMVGAMGVLYGAILNIPLERYLPYLTIGLILWTFISTTLSESTVCFVETAGLSRQMPVPWSLLAARLILRNVMLMAHNVIIIVVVMALMRLWPGWALLLAVPGFVLIVMLLSCLTLFLAVVGARFRDIGPIVQNLLQVSFFLTPILWMPDGLGANREAVALFIDVNPIHHVLEVVRAPLLGQVPSAVSYGVVVALVAASLWITLAVFARSRHKIIFWC
jgi:lipopolysaccharide transport system permease protein